MRSQHRWLQWSRHERARERDYLQSNFFVLHWSYLVRLHRFLANEKCRCHYFEQSRDAHPFLVFLLEAFLSIPMRKHEYHLLKKPTGSACHSFNLAPLTWFPLLKSFDERSNRLQTAGQPSFDNDLERSEIEFWCASTFGQCYPSSSLSESIEYL